MLVFALNIYHIFFTPDDKNQWKLLKNRFSRGSNVFVLFSKAVLPEESWQFGSSNKQKLVHRFYRGAVTLPTLGAGILPNHLGMVFCRHVDGILPTLGWNFIFGVAVTSPNLWRASFQPCVGNFAATSFAQIITLDIGQVKCPRLISIW